MTDNEKQLARKALAEWRADLGNPYGFEYPAWALTAAEPIKTERGCYIFKLTSAYDGVLGFVLADAVYPLYKATYKYDLVRSLAIICDWERVMQERRARNGRKDGTKR